MTKKRRGRQRVPAIPPEDYRGSVSDWMIALQERGLWDGTGWHGDVMITSKTWWDILKECEGDRFSEFEEEIEPERGDPE